VRNIKNNYEKIEGYIGVLLRFGVVLSIAFIIAGSLLLVVFGPGVPLKGIPAKPSQVTTLNISLQEVASGLFYFYWLSYILTGILILIATPVFRVGFSIALFVAERDWLYVFITVIVFINLLIAIFLVPRLA
jgi:uncharacterized membrane protein